MKMLDLFSGIGGISLAADWAGIETAAFCEIEPFNQKVLNKHWPTVPIFSDIRTLTKKSLEERGVDVGAIDVVGGGFPCQPYSIAGKRKGTEDDRDLWPEMFRIIEEVRPTWVVGENVANFVNMELDRTLSDLESIGYKTRTFVLPACAVGAFHQRKRTFIIANSNSELWESLTVFPGVREESKRKKPQEWEQFFFINHGNNDIEFREEDQSLLCRDDDGIPKELDVSRLKSLGNAVVPQQIYPFFEVIAKIEGL